MQAISEDASRRGVLRSTLPVDAQQDLQGQIGAALAQSQGQLGLQQGEAVSGLQSQIGQLGIDRVGAVNSLANTLNKQDLSRQQFSYQKQRDAQEAEMARQRFEFEKQQAAEQIAIARQRANSSGGGGGGGVAGFGNTPPEQVLNDSFQSFFTNYQSRNDGREPSRQEQDAFIDNWMDQLGVKGRENRQIFWNEVNNRYKRPENPTADRLWR